MTAAIVLAAAASAAVTALIAAALHRRWVGEHDARRWWVTETDMRQLATDAWHYERLARRRWNEQVGDLLDRVSHLTDRLNLLDSALEAKERVVDSLTSQNEALAQVIALDRPQHMRRSPIPPYGRERVA